MQFSCFEFWVREKKFRNALIMSKNLKNDSDQVIVSTNLPLTKISRMPLTGDNYIHVQRHPLTKISRMPLTADNYIHVHQHCSLTKISRMPLTADNYGIKSVNVFLVFIFWLFFILVLTFYFFSLLVPKPINACYFRPFHQSTDGNSWGGNRRN